MCHHALAAARSLGVTKRTDKDLNIVYIAHVNGSQIIECSVWFSTRQQSSASARALVRLVWSQVINILRRVL